MANSIETFFFAWGAAKDQRNALVKKSVGENVMYTDPRGTVEGAQALCDYVAQYTANAPGAAAEVAEDAEKNGTHNVRVRFYGEGWEQYGRYEVQLDAVGLIKNIAGVAEKSE